MPVTPKHPLADLIDGIADANGWSDESIAARARQRGHRLSKSNVSRIRNSPVRSISLEQVTALADGLRTSPRAVLSAAVASMGFSLYEGGRRSPEDAISGDHTISEHDRLLLLSLLDAVRRMTIQEAVDGQPPTTPRAQLQRPDMPPANPPNPEDMATREEILGLDSEGVPQGVHRGT